MAIADDLEQIALQERELQFSSFSYDTAWKLGCWLRDAAREQGIPVVIDIHRFGQPLFYAAMEGSNPDNPNWVRRKSNVVAKFLRSSYAIGIEMKRKGTTLEAEYALPLVDYAIHGGSFPLAVQGAGVIGAITVSGLPQREDHQLVVRALCTLLGKSYEELKLGPES